MKAKYIIYFWKNGRVIKSKEVITYSFVIALIKAKDMVCSDSSDYDSIQISKIKKETKDA